MVFSRDGKMLVTGSVGGKIKIWDVATLKLVKTLGPVGDIGSLALSPDGRLLAMTQFWRPTVRLWDVIEERELPGLSGHSAMVWAVEFSPDGELLASASSDQTIRLWDVKNRKELASFVGHESEIWSLAFSPTGEFLCSGSKDETIALWPAHPIQREQNLKAVHLPRNPPRFSPNGRFLLTLNPQGGLSLVDVNKGQVMQALPEEKIGLWFSSNSATMLTLSAKNSLHFRCIPTNDLCRTIELTPRPAGIERAVAFRDGTVIATYHDGQDVVEIWDTASGNRKAQLGTEIKGIGGMDFSPDGQLLALGGSGGLMEFHDLLRQQRVTCRGHKDGVGTVLFSHDGTLIASASVDNTVELWSAAERREVATLSGHREGVLSVAWSSDDRTLASASADRTLKLWNVATRREMARLPHSAELGYVGFSPDNRCLAYICYHDNLNLLRCPSLPAIDDELKRSPSKGLPDQARANPSAPGPSARPLTGVVSHSTAATRTNDYISKIP
jgi:WD40 repeat protein